MAESITNQPHRNEEDDHLNSQDLKQVSSKRNRSKSSCCVPNCTKAGYIIEDGKDVTFHVLPKEEEHLKQWLVKIRRDVGDMFQVTKQTRICSRHFNDDDFTITKGGRKFLIKGRIPSIFEWSKPVIPRRPKNRGVTPLDFPAEDINDQDDAAPTEECVNEIERLQRMVGDLQKSLEDERAAATLYKKERDAIKTLYSNLLTKTRDEGKRYFSLDNFKDDPSEILFYTGFPDYDTVMHCYALLNTGDNSENIIYCDAVKNATIKTPRPRKLTAKDEFFLVLVRLRQGFFEQHLATLFEVSKTTVSRILTTWINYMYLKLGNYNIWPNHDAIVKTMPESMKEKYPNLTWIIDAFELQTERPSSLKLASMSYSNYKSRNTYKGLIACTPSGQIGFISQLYTGNISDRELTIRSNFLRLPHRKGSMWLVDKGFQIQDLVDHLGIKINMPAFVGKNSQMAAEEVFHTQQVASERIHVERAINKVKNFHIFDRPVPMSMLGSINQIWTVCALLTLFQNPIISA